MQCVWVGGWGWGGSVIATWAAVCVWVGGGGGVGGQCDCDLGCSV